MANTWMNADGLFVKFGTAEGDVAPSGEILKYGDRGELEMVIDYTEMLSATAAIVGSVGSPGAFGPVLPKGVTIEQVEFFVETAFTSSGTIGSATVVLGTFLASDRTTADSATALSTTALTGTALGLATAGTKTIVNVGSTGAGAYIGTVIAANAVINVRNSTHATNPFTAGKLKVRVTYFYAP